MYSECMRTADRKTPVLLGYKFIYISFFLLFFFIQGYIFPFQDSVCRSHGAHLSAHRTAVLLCRPCAFKIFSRFLPVNRERKHSFPVDTTSRITHFIVGLSGTCDALRNIAGMSRDLRCHDTFPDVIQIRQAQMFPPESHSTENRLRRQRQQHRRWQQ